MKLLRWTIIVGYLFFGALPLVWMIVTSTKHRADTISPQPQFIPSLSETQPTDAR